jgi:hypothetical protein
LKIFEVDSMPKKTNGPGKDSVLISTSVDSSTFQEITRLAFESGMTKGGWARAALTDAAKEHAVFKQQKTTSFEKTGKATPQSPQAPAGAKTLRASESFDSTHSTATGKNSLPAG